MLEIIINDFKLGLSTTMLADKYGIAKWVIEDIIRVQLKEDQQEIVWWAGEGQKDRPEIVEWRKLATITNRTSEQNQRLREIHQLIRAENDNNYY